MRSPIGRGKGGYGDEIRRQTDNLPTRTHPHPSGQSLNSNEIGRRQSSRIDSSQDSQNFTTVKNLITRERQILQRQAASQTNFVVTQSEVSNRIGTLACGKDENIIAATTRQGVVVQSAPQGIIAKAAIE